MKADLPMEYMRIQEVQNVFTMDRRSNRWYSTDNQQPIKQFEYLDLKKHGAQKETCSFWALGGLPVAEALAALLMVTFLGRVLLSAAAKKKKKRAASDDEEEEQENEEDKDDEEDEDEDDENESKKDQ